MSAFTSKVNGTVVLNNKSDSVITVGKFGNDVEINIYNNEEQKRIKEIIECMSKETEQAIREFEDMEVNSGNSSKAFYDKVAHDVNFGERYFIPTFSAFDNSKDKGSTLVLKKKFRTL